MRILCFFACLSLPIIFLRAQDAAIDLNRYNENLRMTALGWDFINQGNYAKAIESFETAIKLNHNNADSYVGAATAYMGAQNYDLALSHVDSALSMTQNQSDIHYLAGNIQFHKKNYRTAITYYTHAIRYNDSSEVKVDLPSCHFNRGNAFLALEDYPSAIKDYSMTLREKQDFANAYHNRGVAFKNLSKKQEACNDFHSALSFGSTISDRYVNDYCLGIKKTAGVTGPDRITTALPTKSISASNPVDYSDTLLFDTLYYNEAWELCNKGNHTCLRTGQLHTKTLKFYGPFEILDVNGGKVLSGSYNERGEKEGLFKRYYINDTLYCFGNFEEGKLSGIWKFYHFDGSPSEHIEFLESDFRIVNSWDENNVPGVINGQGKWKKLLNEDGTLKVYLTGNQKEGVKHGKWQIETSTKKIMHREIYKNGEFVSAFRFSRGTKLEEKQLFTSHYFYPQLLDKIELLVPAGDLDVKEYPYMRLDKKQVDNDTGLLPEYRGGLRAFYRCVASNLNYPAQARSRGIKGTVIIKFTVEADGSVTNFQPLGNVGGGLEEEAIRVISQCSDWIPAEKGGGPIATSITIPIYFKL